MNNLKDDDFRQNLISLLKTDKEIQKIICLIKAEPSGGDEEFVDDNVVNYDEQIAELEELVEKLKITKKEQDEELANAERHIMVLHEECLDLKKHCSCNEDEIKKRDEKIIVLMKELEENECRLMQADQQAKELDCINDDLKKALEESQSKYEEIQEKLRQRFDRGGDIFTRYQSCKEKLPLQVGNVIRREGFEAFIVGLAQPDSLEQLWEAARDAVLQNRDDVQKKLLWDMFIYSMELINQTVAEPLYELETVEKGDAYDMERHTIVRGSRIQGNVTEVIFPGYRNLHTGRVEPSFIRI